ncbi:MULTISPECIES: hypothetical protein [Sulfitobacter]|jgi:hypothetical protein|uniref:hypothetical protein n=1 Tax=Sulfitobacter TaxID=60136 RepID=UPI00111499EA|nr:MULTISPECIES: hypothetical protein [Sulfitobacter]QPO09541.1 hypothetical protein IT972_04655 [Sulfitobacter sp. B30-2]
MSLSLNEAPVQVAERKAKRYDLCRVLAPSDKDAQMTAQVPKVSALGGSLTIIATLSNSEAMIL